MLVECVRCLGACVLDGVIVWGVFGLGDGEEVCGMCVELVAIG